MKLRRMQIARRLVQVAVVLMILAIPAVARYRNYLASRELTSTLEKWNGTFQGACLSGMDAAFRALPGAEHERAGRIDRDREGIMAATQTLRGGPWSIQMGPLSMTDPLAGAESIVGSKRMLRVLLVSLIIPVLVALVLGRVFCSWICPMHLLLEMTDTLRRLFRFLELRPRDLKFDRRTKYVVLGVGLFMTALLSRPVLGYVYPPAIINRELHDFVFGLFDRAEQGLFGVSVAGLTWMSLILVGIVLVEITISRRWWCRYICPGGALYSLLSWRRPVRVVLDENACTRCTTCVEVCPVGLSPMENRMGAECDNCGLCVSHCDDKALDVKIRIKGTKTLLPILLLLLCVSTAGAHHILGIPHYAYDEQYPQTPVLTYHVVSGPFDIRMTGYPGKPRPGERCSIYVYVKHVEDDSVFEDVVTCTVFRKRWFRPDLSIYGPIEAELDQAVYKFYPQFEEESDYLLRIAFEEEDVPWIIDLPMVVGEPGSPWLVLGSVLGGGALFVIVIRAIRIKRERRLSGAAARGEEASGSSESLSS